MNSGNQLLSINKRDIGVFVLVLYSCMTNLKHIFFPIHAMVPIALALAIVLLIPKYFGKNVLAIPRNIHVQYAWMIAAIIVLIYNYEFFSEFRDGGVVQFIILCFFIVFMKTRDDWQEKYYNLLAFFLIIHAVFTIVTVLSPSVYSTFVKLIYPEDYSKLIYNYGRSRYAGLCTNYSTNGSYLAMGTVLFFIKAMFDKRLRFRLLLILVIAALMACGKRGAFVFAIFSCSISYLILNINKKSKTMRFIILGAVAVAVVYIAAQYVPFLNNTLSRFAELENSRYAGRDVLYSLAIQMFKSNPLFGHGWGSYKYYANASVIGLIYGKDSNMYAHNCYLQLLAETGVVGLLVFLWCFIGTLQMTISQIVSLNKGDTKNIDMKDVFILTSSLGIQLYFLSYCITGNPLYDYPCLFPYMMSCAIPLSYKYKELRVKLQKTTTGRPSA